MQAAKCKVGGPSSIIQRRYIWTISFPLQDCQAANVSGWLGRPIKCWGARRNACSTVKLSNLSSSGDGPQVSPACLSMQIADMMENWKRRWMIYYLRSACSDIIGCPGKRSAVRGTTTSLPHREEIHRHCISHESGISKSSFIVDVDKDTRTRTNSQLPAALSRTTIPGIVAMLLCSKRPKHIPNSIIPSFSNVQSVLPCLRDSHLGEERV